MNRPNMFIASVLLWTLAFINFNTSVFIPSLCLFIMHLYNYLSLISTDQKLNKIQDKFNVDKWDNIERID